MTILIGRFIGLVRAIAPFIAGASHMPLRKFLPYDVLGAGLWATTFCVLGYVFWRSFDQLTAWVSRGLFAFGLVVAVIVGIVFLVRLQRSPELQARTQQWIAEQLERPLLRPVAPYLRAGWHRIVRPVARASETPARFVWNRFTPGELGLEVTTLLSLAAVGSFMFALLGSELAERTCSCSHRAAFDIADRLYSDALKDVAVWVTALGSFAVVRAARASPRRSGRSRGAASSTPACSSPRSCSRARGRTSPRRASTGRGRPARTSTPTAWRIRRPTPPTRSPGSPARSCSSAAAAACPRGFAPSTAARRRRVVVGLTRVYLRAHYLSDVEGGWGLAVAIFALLGVVALVVGRLRQNEAPQP